MDIRQICITHLHKHNSRVTHVRRHTYTRKHAKESDYQASVHLQGLMIGLGQLNLRNSNCLALFGAKFGLDGVTLCTHLFLDRKDFSLVLLLKTGAGGLGKRVRSLKSLRIFFHLSVRISCIVGLHRAKSMHNGVRLSFKGLYCFGANIAVLLVCFIFQIRFSTCLLYPLRRKCLTSLLLYFWQIFGDVVLRMTLVISPMAMPLCICAGM